MAKDDGGQVYPQMYPERDDALCKDPGMTRRDWLAGIIAAGYRTGELAAAGFDGSTLWTPQQLADRAYADADALIAKGKEE